MAVDLESTDGSPPQDDYWHATCLLLPKNKFTIIDADDHELLITRRWHVRKGGGRNLYVSSYVWDGRRATRIHLHRVLAGCAVEMVVDHINSDSLDNRKANLRVCTRTQNNANRRRNRNAVGRFKGVYPTPNGKWIAQISDGTKNLHLGTYDKEVEAAKAWNDAAVNFRGDFALLNDL